MRTIALLVVFATATGCVSGSAEVETPVPTLFDDASTSTTVPVSSVSSSVAPASTLAIVDRLPALADAVPDAVFGDDGVVLPITGTDGDVYFLLGPCGEDRVEPVSTATLVGPQHVVLDPGGDGEAGAVNLAVAQRTAEILAADGVEVVLTRTGDAEIGGATRGAVGPAVGSALLVSIHRGDGSTETEDPRPTIFHRADDADSRRLAGLLHQELMTAYDDLDGVFVGHDEPGVRPLLNQRGDDYFRVLETSAGVAAARAELFALGENETTLLTSEEGRDVEARALADAIVRFLVSSEEGDGFIDPIEVVRVAPTSNTPGGC